MHEIAVFTMDCASRLQLHQPSFNELVEAIPLQPGLAIQALDPQGASWFDVRQDSDVELALNLWTPYLQPAQFRVIVQVQHAQHHVVLPVVTNVGGYLPAAQEAPSVRLWQSVDGQEFPTGLTQAVQVGDCPVNDSY